MVTTVKQLDWSYVQIIAQESQYFTEVLDEFTSKSLSHNVCALKVFRLNEDSTDKHIHQVLQDLNLENETKAVLLFMDSSFTRYVRNEIIKCCKTIDSLYILEFI